MITPKWRSGFQVVWASDVREQMVRHQVGEWRNDMWEQEATEVVGDRSCACASFRTIVWPRLSPPEQALIKGPFHVLPLLGREEGVQRVFLGDATFRESGAHFGMQKLY